MLTFAAKCGTISRLFCSLSNKISARRIILQLKSSNYVVGYVNHNSIGFFQRNRAIFHGLRSPMKSFISSAGSSYSTEYELSSAQYEKVCDETLDSLSEYFEELVEAAAHLPDADISYGDGVLTVKFGDPHGTYVINRQTPNKQIWLSSPKSGPKRYDFINGQWIYRHDGKSLHELLNNEIPGIIRNQACFDKCSFSGREKHAAIDDLFSGKTGGN